MAPAALRRVFKMVASQTYRRLRVVAVSCGDPQRVKELAASFPELNLAIVEHDEALSDTTLPSALSALGPDCFTFADESVSWFPSHIQRLVSALTDSERENATAGLAHTGVVTTTSGSPSLSHFEPLLAAFQDPPLGAWLARTYLLDATITSSPHFRITDDRSIGRMLLARGRSVFSGTVTCSAEETEPTLSGSEKLQLEIVGGMSPPSNLVVMCQSTSF